MRLLGSSLPRNLYNTLKSKRKNLFPMSSPYFGFCISGKHETEGIEVEFLCKVATYAAVSIQHNSKRQKQLFVLRNYAAVWVIFVTSYFPRIIYPSELTDHTHSYCCSTSISSDSYKYRFSSLCVLLAVGLSVERKHKT